MTSPTYAPIGENVDLFINEDVDIYFRIYTGFSKAQPIAVAAAAADGATSITIAPLRYTMSIGDKVYFARAGILAKLSSAAALGDTSLAVAAIAAPIPLADSGRVIVDLSAFSLAWVLTTTPDPSASPVISKTPTLVNDPADPDTGSPAKVAKVSIAAADLTAQTPGSGFYHRLRRTNAGLTRTLAQGDVVLKGD